MQGIYELKLSADEQAVFKLATAVEWATLLDELIVRYADQLGYMLQTYHPREKVSQVAVVTGSIITENLQSIAFKLEYTIEEYNACSAVDTDQKAKMNMTAAIDSDAGLLIIKGENWPQRED